MALERALKRLTLQPSSVCRQCHRAFSVAARPQAQNRQSETSAFADLIESSRTQSRTGTPATADNTAPPAVPARQNAFDLMQSGIQSVTADTPARQARRTQELADLQRNATRKDLEQQVPRRWKAGDVYAPHDLSGVEMSKWKKVRRKPKTKRDVLDQLGVDPMKEYKNYSIMSEYVTEMGRIKHSNDTGLRPVNQRRMARAVRRSIGIGLMPSVYRHPEILREELFHRGRQF